MVQEPVHYVVTRDSRRVSSTNHIDRKCAAEEEKYWRNIVYQWDPGSIIRIRKTTTPYRIK